MLIERSLYSQISGDEPLGGKGRVDEYGNVGVKHGQEVPFFPWHGIPS
jgi:hypothetical protein